MRGWSWCLATVLAIAMVSSPAAAEGLSRDFFIKSMEKDSKGWFVVLGNHRTFRLNTELKLDGQAPVPIARQRDEIRRAGAPRAHRPPPGGGVLRPRKKPAQFSLAAQQTPIRDQGGRDTCTWFAVTAGIEAAYRRAYGVTVDLSEQYFSNALKMNLIFGGRNVPLNEDQAGLWGGGSILTNVGFLIGHNLGLPLESTVPYIRAGEYQNPDAGDAPDIADWSRTTYTQRVFDDLNLSAQPTPIQIPQAITVANFPRAAAISARYGPLAFTEATPQQRNDVKWYTDQIWAGREVVIQFACCATDQSGAFISGPSLPASHALILMGYDDATGMFQAKNQWAENTWRGFSYDLVSQGHVQAAFVIDRVKDPTPQFRLDDNGAAFMGRWTLVDAGVNGVLDIYGGPVLGTTSPLGRIGTFFDAAGNAYRVNGRSVGQYFEFYIDRASPDFATGSQTGDHYQVVVLENPKVGGSFAFVGQATGPGGAVRGVYATTRPPLPPVAGPGPLYGPDLVGTWQVITDNGPDLLQIKTFDPATGALTGQLGIATGPQANVVTGSLGSNGVDVTLTWTVGPPGPLRLTQTVQGRVMLGQRGIMAGFDPVGRLPATGFAAIRVTSNTGPFHPVP